MDGSILKSIGLEIIGVMVPVSIYMLLVVLLVYSLSSFFFSSFAAAPIHTAANLVYLETPSNSITQKLKGALLNALVFVIIISIVTFFLVLLYCYKFTNFLKNCTRFSAFFVLATMGYSIFLSMIQHFLILIDSITCFVLLFNFTIIVAAWFTNVPEWTTWVLLIALALYDLVTVLAPGGLLKILVELALSQDEELPALVYKARPTMVGGFSDSSSVEL
ncbi:Presenilin-like protein [Camellia lanceoleosa]|uniref:Presenilin-like protein n=1 Tax=Camellia lanceoleosa TaxID=1840588 RepID=A0ACC0I0N3_9ERIC|nr:Presenilin-like protein [Camellia lanceoleosa]